MSYTDRMIDSPERGYKRPARKVNSSPSGKKVTAAAKAEAERKAREKRRLEALRAKAKREAIWAEFKQAESRCRERAAFAEPWKLGQHSDGYGNMVPNWVPSLEELRREGFPY